MAHGLYSLVILSATLIACRTSNPHDGPRMVTVGTRELWIDCQGNGSPTVLLEAGHGQAADSWTAVQSEIARFTRVCSYDRAGRGLSPPAADSIRRGADVVTDLNRLLTAARESPPVVLVGHSLGGAFVRLYADAHPDDIAALVLVDAVHEDEFQRIDALLTPAQRLAGAGMRPMSRERFDIEAIFSEVRAIARPPSVPVTVIGRGRPMAPDEFPPDWSLEQRAARESLRTALQLELSTRFRSRRLVLAEQSGHFVHQDEPAVVVAEVRRLVDTWRASKGAT